MNDLIHADRNSDGSLRITIAPAMANHVAHMIVMLASQLQNGQAIPPAEGVVMSAPVRLRYGGRMKITKRELAETLGVSMRTIDHWRADRMIPHRKIRGVVLFDPAEVEQALERFKVYAYWEPKRRMGRIQPPSSPA